MATQLDLLPKFEILSQIWQTGMVLKIEKPRYLHNGMAEFDKILPLDLNLIKNLHK